MGLDSVKKMMDRGLLNYAIDSSLELLEGGAEGNERAGLYRVCSDAMFRKKQYIDAAAYGEKAVEADGENGEGYMHLGWAEYWLGKNSKALEHLKKAATLLPGSAEAHYRLGSILNNAFRDSEEADKAFSRAVEIDPGNALAWQQRGIARFNSGRTEEAYADYRKGAEAGDPYCGYILDYYGQSLETPGEKLALARDFWDQNQPQRTVEIISEALEQGFTPAEKQVDVIMELGDKLSWMKENEKAEDAYRRALEMAPNNPEAWGRRGWLYYCISRDAEAETDFRKALELEPANPRYQENLGRLLLASGRAEEALALLDEAIERDGMSPGLFHARALCHKETGSDEKAREDFLKADYFGHRDALRDSRAAYGDLHAMDFFSAGIENGDAGNREGAVEAFRKAAELFGADARIRGDWNWRYQSKSLHNLGYYIHISGGDPAEAVLNIEKALEMDPGYKDAWISLGNALNGNGDDSRALECYDRAVELQPNDGRGYYSRGRIKLARGDFDAGADDFSQAISWYTRRDWQGDAFYNRARCHEGAGRIEQAVADYEEAFNRGIQQGITESFRLKDAYGLE